jgi:hypothetical protein
MSNTLECGLACGELSLHGDCAGPVRSNTLHRDRRPRWKELSEFLENQKMMIKGMDKNLGPVIFSRDWYISEVEKFLADGQNYRKLEVDWAGDPSPALLLYNEDHAINGRFKWLANTIHEVRRDLTHITQSLIDVTTKQEQEYLERWNLQFDIPRFHGIPKIHKKPWAIRPIAPGHSWVTSPLAKWVQVKIAGAAKATPWIVQSTKDVAALLRKTIIPDRRTRRKMFVCTGDVVAMYPNIPADAHSIVAAWFADHPAQLDPVLNDNVHLFQNAMRIINQYGVVEFNGAFYSQLKGLAMGAACSPDIANIYAAYYEEQNINFNVQTFGHDNPIKVYCRYIDDCLSIIEADSAEHCWAILSKHNLGPVLRTEWSVIVESEGPSPFLDLEIDILSGSTLDFKLYRKPFNHFMRIPWESAHPTQVKKSGFQGELTRIATCSSRREFYDQSVAEYMELLIARGYPRQVLLAWKEQEVEKRWCLAVLLKVDPKAHSYAVLKTSYNDVWCNVNIASFKTAIIDGAIEAGALSTKDALFLESIRDTRFLISYKRTRNLSDDVNALNVQMSRIDPESFNDFVTSGAFDLSKVLSVQRAYNEQTDDDDSSFNSSSGEC